MRSKHYCAMVLSVVLLLSFCASAQAWIYRVKFSAWTRNYTDQAEQKMCFYFDPPFDSWFKNSLDVIKSMTVTAPDGTVFDISIDDHYGPYSPGFFAQYKADAFKSEEIPTGRYVLEVVDLWDMKTTVSDHVEVAFLEPPVILSPTPGSTVGKRPLIMWTPVPGAEVYRILLNDEWGSPIYDHGYHVLMVNNSFFLLPLGDLKPDQLYSLQIEARDSDQDLDNRSQSDWVDFRTEPW